MDYTFKQLIADHKSRGIWEPSGYHFYVRRSGKRHVGRSLEQVGAHAAPYNTRSIGICLEGGLKEDHNGNLQDQENWEDNYTNSQHAEVLNIIHECLPILKKAGNDLKNLDIIGHCDVPDVEKACPGFDANDKYGWICE